ncbi:SufD family Fe-S cluster assembly protein [Sphingomicrobium astaxanthinifaciens]|uniref:SufD family Fe-S cluster assembly protein n=1 Tax=Sphingomicrobium astaxanthinifaciens TaxID=1227949 RepID=UPI001FCC4253|nr:SufD family Fe-S cluster assembly protein [Sphingomicrobium astaxanthinifaciens]MCJ7421320.1 SufD family Fe-S cluster assembly protein [Sphingomicrobium astaxanthinifaciens]
MTAPLPTRADEAFRYADIKALGEVWDDLGPPETVEIAAHKSLQQTWLPSGDPIDVKRARIVIEQGAALELYALNAADRYGRIELDVTLHAGADFAFRAANVGSGDATLEVVTVVRHVAPDATSTQTVRSVLGHKAVGSYLGQVAVAREAQKTNSEQDIKAMLLSREATANAKPELEIYADDVACAHGATVGELDAMQLYYAAARGLPPAQAKALLLEGFIGGLWDALGEDSEIAALARTRLRELTR